MALLEIEHVTKRYQGVVALDDVDIVVEPGTIVGIIGPNGAGKSTLFNVITGVDPPSAGRVRFKGEDLSGLALYATARRGIARTFQHSLPFANLSVLENVLVARYGRRAGGWRAHLARWVSVLANESDDARVARRCLALAGLGARSDLPAASLAFPDLRRLEIARALATDPALLLLDEPTAGMNPQEAHEVMLLIGNLRREGYTVAVIEHNLRVIMGVCQRVVVLDHGTKIADDVPEVVQEDPRVIDAYIGRSETGAARR
ncbi:MAG: ABC transporter ATP-binding protein [Chloroflexi bacterium]|nr:ABC transporter ATP-binding protein [Chloroflexota bacterium]